MEPEVFARLLVDRGLIKADQIPDLLARAGQSQPALEDIILAEGLIAPSDLARLKAAALNLPFIDLAVTAIDPQAMQNISASAARTYQFIAFGRRNQQLQIAMANPDDLQAREAIRFIAAGLSLSAEIYVATASAIAAAIPGTPPARADQTLQDFARELKQIKNLPSPASKLQAALAKAPINKVVAVIIRHAVDGGASNIHIEPSSQHVRVRYRIDGRLHTSLLLPAELQTALNFRIKSLAGLPATKTDLPQTSRFALNIDNHTFSLRVATAPTINGERLNLRLVNTSTPPPALADLGLTNEQQTRISRALRSDRGLVVFASPSRADVSATLSSALWSLNKSDISIATIEDNIGVEIPGISQTEIKTGSGLTFSRALSSLLEQDIDVIMVSDLADSNTARLVAQAARDKLILVASSAADVAAAVEHLIALTENSNSLAQSLRLVIAQISLPQLCPHCRISIEIPAALKKDLQTALKKIPQPYLQSLHLDSRALALFDSRGCPKCSEAKTKGQIGLFEVVHVFLKLKQRLAAGTTRRSLENLIRSHGFLSLKQQGIIKALQGQVRYADVVRLIA